MNTPRMLKPRDVAAQLNVSVRTLESWRRRGIGPHFVQIGTKTIRYPEDTLQEYVAAPPSQRPILPGELSTKVGDYGPAWPVASHHRCMGCDTDPCRCGRELPR